MSFPLPAVPDSDKVKLGAQRMSEDRTAGNTLATRVQPVALGGTGGTTKVGGKNGLGIGYGAALPAAGDEGDLFFVVV